MAQFKRGGFSTCGALRPGRLKTVATLQIIDQIHDLPLEYRRISAKPIVEQQSISREWVRNCLNADQKLLQCQAFEQVLEFFLRNPNDFLSRLLTMDETWLYNYDPETKQQSTEWRYSVLPCIKFRAQKSAGKF